jgi:hypothetical protein
LNAGFIHRARLPAEELKTSGSKAGFALSAVGLAFDSVQGIAAFEAVGLPLRR